MQLRQVLSATKARKGLHSSQYMIIIRFLFENIACARLKIYRSNMGVHVGDRHSRTTRCVFLREIELHIPLVKEGKITI